MVLNEGRQKARYEVRTNNIQLANKAERRLRESELILRRLVPNGPSTDHLWTELSEIKECELQQFVDLQIFIDQYSWDVDQGIDARVAAYRQYERKHLDLNRARTAVDAKERATEINELELQQEALQESLLGDDLGQNDTFSRRITETMEGASKALDSLRKKRMLVLQRLYRAVDDYGVLAREAVIGGFFR